MNNETLPTEPDDSLRALLHLLDTLDDTDIFIGTFPFGATDTYTIRAFWLKKMLKAVRAELISGHEVQRYTVGSWGSNGRKTPLLTDRIVVKYPAGTVLELCADDQRKGDGLLWAKTLDGALWVPLTAQLTLLP